MSLDNKLDELSQEDLENYFNQMVSQWEDHCEKVQFYSFRRVYYECDPCREIIGLGYKALPLIRKLCDKPSVDGSKLSSLQACLHHVVGQIVGKDFQMPENIRGRVIEMENFTKNWLDQNMNKYLSLNTG